MPRTVDPDYPLTFDTEARVIIDAGDTVRYYDSVRDAALYAAAYAGRYAIFVTASPDVCIGDRVMVTFDCSL